MDFEKLTKEEMIAYWNEVSSDIEECLVLCGSAVPNDLALSVRESLSHNELGIALEILIDASIDNGLPIDREAKLKLLETLIKMGYQEDEPLQFQSYEKWLVSI